MGDVKARVETVTPARAQKMLLTNHQNRPLTAGRVEQYVGAMQRGEWTLNGEPITFNGDGSLLNGQDRLEAVVQSDTPQQFVIVRGVETDAQSTMDQGQKRSLGDIFQMRGLKFATTLALSTRATLAYERVAVPVTMYVRPAPTITELLDCFDRHGDIAGHVYAGGSTNAILTLSTGWKTALSHLFAHADKDAAATFFQYLESGSPRGSTDPLTLLRKRLERDATSRHERMQPVMRVALVIKAFNAFRSGERTSMLVWKPAIGEEFPRIVDCDLNP